MNLTSLVNGPGEDDDFAFAFEQDFGNGDQYALEDEEGEMFEIELE